MRRVLPTAAVCSLLWSICATTAVAQALPQDETLRQRLLETAAKIVLPERCGECHQSAFQVWQTTKHATGFETLHRSERAKEIYRKLGLRLIKRGTEETTPACLQCHYTPVVRHDDELRAGAGVTCESCHGPAADWIRIHNDYGVPEPDFQVAALLETPEHRATRIAQSRAAGMRRPSDLYEVAANCFACHTVPNEELVNRAGHSTGSDFELVAWTQGDIRHNFLESFKTGDGRTNAERPDTWKRVMYVVGRALDAEYSLRGVAKATTDDLYFSAMSDRAGAAFDQLLEIGDRIDAPDIRAILETMDGVELKLNNRAALLAAADQIGDATRQFIASSDGSRLAALDPLWNPDAAEAERTRLTAAREAEAPAAPPAPEAAAEPVPETPAAVPAPTVAAAEEPVGESPPAATPAPAPAAAAPPPTPAVPSHTVYSRPPWTAEPTHEFIKKVPCGRCHNPQERWWRGDPHSRSSAPFRAEDPKNVAIATAYGIAADDMARADHLCMSCHGTAVTINSRKVRPGVGCQRCHGPGVDYEKPHETDYVGSVALGLVDLKDPAVRAKACDDCHYITDQGLINAGHVTGADFDLAAGVAAIKHWGDAFAGTAVDLAPSALSAAHAAEIATRGPAPVPATPPPAALAAARRAAPTPGPAGAPAPAAPPSPETAASPTATARRPSAPAAPAAVPADAGTAASSQVAEASPATGPPAAEPDTTGEADQSLEELLLQVKERLESLYRQLGRAPR